jgi:hypothetical protein
MGGARMSVVPREVVDNLIMGSECRDPKEGMRLDQYKLADRLAQWALEQAMQKCQSVVDQYSDEYGVDGACAAAGCYAAIRSLMKGGESDEN